MTATPVSAAGPARPRRTRLRRAARLAAWSAGGLVVLWFAFAAWIESTCVYEAPALPASHPALALRPVDAGGGVVRCGDAWVHRDLGISELYLEGDAVARGSAMASLCSADMDAQEAQLFADLDRLVPGAVRRYFVRKAALFLFRDFQDHVDDGYELEAAAMVPALARGSRPSPADAFPIYHRVLFYQSLYDIGQAMAEAGIVESEIACTTFAASGAATAGGRLVLARNCDFEAGPIFDDRKVVFFVAPDRGARYVAVSWAGMMGVVSGVNEHGLALVLHAARTERTRWPRTGTPVPFLLRDALLHDRTIEEVAERFRRNGAHAAALVVAAEAATGRSAVIETDPERTVVVPATDEVSVCANTLTAPEWQADTVVAAGLRAGSSPLRHARLRELVDASRGRLDVATAGSILRDRKGVGGIDTGLGNRSTISAVIAAHAIVYDAAAGRLHVSRAPRGLGEFVAYDVARFFAGGRPAGPADVRAAGPAAIPAADVGRVADIDRARAILRDCAPLLASGDDDDAERARVAAEEAAALTDDSPEALLCLAEALATLGRADASRAAAERALGRQPVPGPERERLLTLAGRRER